MNFLGKIKPTSFQATAVDKESEKLPCFDLAEIEEAKGELRKELIGKLVCVFETIGIAAFHAPHLEDMAVKAFQGAHEFFSKDEESKCVFSEKDSLGYVPFGQENLRGETIKMTRYRYIPDKFKIPESMGAAVEVGKEYNQIARRFSTLLAEGIGIKPEELPITDKFYSVSIKHYPNPHDLNVGQVINPHHRDISPITILAAGSAGGLQFFRDGVYKDVEIPKGCVVANTGDHLCNKTAGRFKGVDHRVVKTGSWPEQGRYQIAVFNDFPGDFSLAPIPQLIDDALGKMKDAYLGQFITGTDQEQDLAYQWSVMGDFSGATTEKIDDLIEKGFLRSPSEQLVKAFPDCKWGNAKERDDKLKEAGLISLFENSAS